MKPKNNGFVLSSMTDMAVNIETVGDTNLINYLLNDNLALSKYTEKIREMGLIFMALDPTTHSFRPDRIFWRWKRGIFDMYMNVPDYQAFCNATPLEAKITIAQLYLKGIKTYLAQRNDIDHEKLYQDMKKLFADEKLVSE